MKSLTQRCIDHLTGIMEMLWSWAYDPSTDAAGRASYLRQYDEYGFRRAKLQMRLRG